MKQSFNLAGVFGTLLLVALLGWPSPAKQVVDQVYFPETGHTVKQPFLDYFNRTGGLASYGFPITEDFVDPRTGLLVQYFEKARLEWHPGNPDPQKVQLGLLGDELGKRGSPIPIRQIPAPNDPACEYFNETGHSLCMAFREYYYRNGALERFGYPIAEFGIEGDHVVQWFQRARLEWHPEKPEGQRVQVAPLGSMYYHELHLDPERLKPRYDGTSPGTVRTLIARGSVINPVAVSDGSQTAFIYVTDQLGQPISAASVTLIVHYPDRNEILVLPPTSGAGTSFVTYTVPPVTPGYLVWMEFAIAYEGVFTTTRTSFMVWY